MKNMNQMGWVFRIAITSTLVLGLHGCFSTSDPIEERSAIGVLDFQRIIDETNAGKEVTDTLNNFMKDRQALIELEQRELRRLENEILAQGSVISEPARKQREEVFRRRMMQYQQKVTDLNQEVQEKQKELLNSFRQSVEEVVAEIARTQDLTLVVEYGKGSSTLYHKANTDITEDVILELDRR